MALNQIFNHFSRIFKNFKDKDNNYKVLNWKYFIYIVLTSLLFLVDGDQLNLQIFSNFFDWDLKSTRITFYPIIFILLIAFIENSIGTKNFKSKFNNLIKFFKNKIKSSIYFKI